MHLPWVRLVIASRALLVIRQLLEQRIDVLEGHQGASGGRKSRESRSSPDTNQSLDVASWLQMDRSVSRMRPNSLVCWTKPKVRAGDLKLKTFLLSPIPPASQTWAGLDGLASLKRFGCLLVFGHFDGGRCTAPQSRHVLR